MYMYVYVYAYMHVYIYICLYLVFAYIYTHVRIYHHFRARRRIAFLTTKIHGFQLNPLAGVLARLRGQAPGCLVDPALALPDHGSKGVGVTGAAHASQLLVLEPLSPKP